MGTGVGKVVPPRPLDSGHIVEGFDCGDAILDGFLQTALKNQERNNCVCHVVADSENRVIGFYTLSSQSIRRLQKPRGLHQQTPDPIPTVLLGRFAVDRKCQRKGLGAGLLRDALQKVASASSTVGTRAVIVDAKTDSIKGYYERLGFRSIGDPDDPLRLFLLTSDIAKTLASLSNSTSPKPT